MSAYRIAPAQSTRKADVRRLTVSPLGLFGIVVWDSFFLVGGAVCALMLHIGDKDGLGLRAGAAIGGVSLGLAFLFTVSVLLFETRLTLVARIEEGTLTLVERQGIGTKRERTFALSDLTGATVEDHDDDRVAAVLHTRPEQIPIFPTRIGDDARRVARFVVGAIVARRTFTACGPEDAAELPAGEAS